MRVTVTRRFTRSLLVVLLLLAATFLGLGFQQLRARRHNETANLNDVPHPGEVQKAIVTAKMPDEDVQWIHDLRPDWIPYIYTAAQPPEPGYSLIPPGYRGRESIVYLDFIVRHYPNLPNITAFVHAKPQQWHNDVIGPDTAPILKNLRLDSVMKQGYLNFRCGFDPGCPVGVNSFEPTDIDINGHDIRAYFLDTYMELFNVPQNEVPERIGNICCGQFAVSKQRILERPLKDYQRMLQWALEGNVTTSFGIGWVFEKVWHIIFGMPAQHCPSYEQCRCDVVGWCGPIPEDCQSPLTSSVEREKRSFIEHEEF